MKVREIFESEKLDAFFIEYNFEGSYWESCSNFIAENWNRELESMTQKQAKWFDKILDDCVEKRIEG